MPAGQRIALVAAAAGAGVAATFAQPYRCRRENGVYWSGAPDPHSRRRSTAGSRGACLSIVNGRKHQ
jgi:hypothetical protein